MEIIDIDNIRQAQLRMMNPELSVRMLLAKLEAALITEAELCRWKNDDDFNSYIFKVCAQLTTARKNL